MTSRRLIRIKVLQLLYSHLKNEGKQLTETERDLTTSIRKSTDLYYLALSLLPELRFIAERKIDIARNKHLPTETDLNPNTRFIENPVIIKLENSVPYQNVINRKEDPIRWGLDGNRENNETLTYFYNKLIKSDLYKNYMSAPSVTFAQHKEFVVNLFSELIAPDEIFYQTCEEMNVYWNDDYEFIIPLVQKTLKNIKEDADITFSTIFAENDDESIFAHTLLRRAVCDRDQYTPLIAKYTENWNVERMSEMDRIIMDLTIAEWINFPEIPVKVTLNEYIDIAKCYSSSKSNSFINGILDKILTELKESSKIQKSGRGLVG